MNGQQDSTLLENRALDSNYLDVQSESTDTLPIGVRDTLAIQTDTLPNGQAKTPTQTQQISPDALDIKVNYGAVDTQWYDHKLKQVHLFGEAYVYYGTMELTAGYIILDMELNEAQAYSIKDTEGHEVQKPTFKDGEQQFTYDQLRFNFDTNKGIVNQAVTQFTDLYVLGAKTKFVASDEATGREDDVIYNSDALITSCNHDEPHFGIRTKKLKVIPKKVGVTGPAQLEIAGVPTPLALPFGFFPLTDGRSTGLKFPKNFPYQESLGFGIQGVGWYFPINDYMDLELTADYYTRGTWGVNSNYRYKKRYKYNGGVKFSFRNTITENESTLVRSSNRSMSFRVNHNQDSKAHPYRSIGGSIDFSTSGHYQATEIDFNNRITNQYGSNFYFKHKMPNTPFSLDVGLKHRQNTNTRSVDITLPDINLTMQTIQPFKRKKAVGNERWYEKINVSGKSRMANFVETSDSTVFTRETLENMRSGVTHDYNANVSFNFMKYFNISPRVSYSEDWVGDTQEKKYFEENDSIAEIVVRGFDTYRTWNAGADLTTALFGTITSDDGWFRGIRHTVKPRIGYSIDPDSRSRYVDTISYNSEFITSFSRFDDGPFGTPRFTDLSQSLTYGLTNVVELKYYSKRKEEEKKVILLNALNVNGSYNFAADSLNWSTVGISGNTNIIKGFSNLRFNFTLDPYLQQDTRTINQLVSTQQKIPLRLHSGNITLSSDITVKQIFDFISGEGREERVPRESRSLFGRRQAGKPPGELHEMGKAPPPADIKDSQDGSDSGEPVSQPGVDREYSKDQSPIKNTLDDTKVTDDPQQIIDSTEASDGVETPSDMTQEEAISLLTAQSGDSKEVKNTNENRKKKIGKAFGSPDDISQTYVVNYEARAPSWSEILGNFKIDHNLSYNITSRDNRDTIFVSKHSIGVRGSLAITDNWSVNVGNIGYDFSNDAFTYPFLGFTRKLHCWYMTFDWAPTNNAFGFFIGVNSGTLDFMKYNYGQNNIQNGISNSFR